MGEEKTAFGGRGKDTGAMKIAIGNDHGGVELKRHLVEYLTGKGYEVIDLGAQTTESCNYPVFGQSVGQAVVAGEADYGVLICGTGIGISIAANKVDGVRCALCSEPVSARLAREHNNANIVAMGARTIGPVMAEGILDVFLNTGFQGGRHATRVGMFERIEKGEQLD